MTIPFVPQVGAVLSADIAVPDHPRELRFYAQVLGTGTEPLWRDDLLNNLGIPIIGLGERAGDHVDLPLQWMPHVQVADVDRSMERAEALGGEVVMQAPPGDPGEGTAWAVLRDPAGAAFGIIPVVPADAVPQMVGGARPASPATATRPVGRIAWLDLTVPDAPRVRDFYREVVGWSVEDVAMRDARGAYADYVMKGENGDPVSGVCHCRGPNAELPPVWLLYLSVGDLAASLERVEAEGGSVLKVHRGAEGEASYAVIRDPVGVAVALSEG